MKKIFSKNATKLLSSLALGAMLLGMVAQTASAAILFQDDTFADVESDAIKIGSNDAGAVNTSIQFGADSTASENGVMTWDITTNSFGLDHTLNVTGGLSATGQVDFSSATGVRLRESSSPNTLAACATLNEVIVNTSSNTLMICTTTGVAGVAVWTAPSPAVPTGTPNPATCSPGQLFFNTTSATLQVCTATNTWNTAGPQDFEAVYGYDADKVLTTGGGNFGITAGAGNIDLTNTTGKTTITSAAAAADAIELNASGASSGITANWGTGGLNFASTTGAFSISGTGASTMNATSGNLNLTTTTSGDIAMVSAGNITFDDATLTAPLKITNTDTALNATFPVGAGILDALNSFTSTSVGSGASNVGVSGTLTNIGSPTDVQAALANINGLVGAGAPNVEDLTFAPQYPDNVIYRDGSNNNGTLVNDFDATNNQQYFRWSTNSAVQQDLNVKFRFPLPPDFVSTGDFTLGYRTGTVTTTDNKVDVTFTDVTKSNTVCGSSITNASANAWATATITAATLNAGCTGGTALAAGDIIEVDVKFFDRTGGTTFADAGIAKLVYSN